MSNKYTEEHEVTFYECDTTGKLTLPMILNIVIKTSEAQSEKLNRGTDYVMAKGLGWVITQHEINITKLPVAEQKVDVTTQATTYNKYFCYRNFWIHDKDGNEMVVISSTFVLMDLKTRKMTSVLDEIIAPYESEKTTKIQRGTKIESVVDTENERQYRVRFSDIDGNKHVNNARYLDWMIDCLDYDFLLQHTPSFVNIRFDKEVEYGNNVESIWELNQETKTSKHRIKLDDINCAEANIIWN